MLPEAVLTVWTDPAAPEVDDAAAAGFEDDPAPPPLDPHAVNPNAASTGTAPITASRRAMSRALEFTMTESFRHTAAVVEMPYTGRHGVGRDPVHRRGTAEVTAPMRLNRHDLHDVSAGE